jgi:S-DNA-T family DNA segregation ATPase FtsK/SpoIIIE
MNRSLHSSNTDYQQSISGLLSLLRAEFLGVLCIIGGALLIASVFGYDSNSRDAAPLLYVLMGWTAPLFAAMILVLGCVLLLGQRAGYWSAEALVGAELLLLGLQLGAWVAANRVVTWTPRLGMEAGGLIGWALGSLALAGLDRPLAGLLAALLVAAAILMLIRYTPLIFLAAPLRRWLPFSKAPQPQRGFAPTAAPPPVVGGHVVSSPTPDGSVRTAPAAPEAEARPKRRGKQPATAQAPAAEKQPAPETERPARSQGVRPPVDLLVADAGSYANADVALLEQVILKTLADFNVPARIIHVETGPTVTQFGVEPLYIEAPARSARCLSAASSTWPTTWRWRWPPTPCASKRRSRAAPTSGIEVPNPHKSLVSLRGIMESAEMRKGGRAGAAAGAQHRRCAGGDGPDQSAAHAHRRLHRVGQVGLYQHDCDRPAHAAWAGDPALCDG